MKYPFVSIIVPTFNNDIHIERFYKYLCEISYPRIEILFINDGSTDKTKAILEKLMKEDSRLRVISLPVNKGTLHARIRGFQEARGSYMLQSDCDDVLDRDIIQKAVEVAKESDCDLVHFNTKIVHVDGKTESMKWAQPYHKSLAGKDYLRLVMGSKISHMMVNSFYSSSVVKAAIKSQVFDELIDINLKQWEDLALNLLLAKFVKKYVPLFDFGYYYHLRKDSNSSAMNKYLYPQALPSARKALNAMRIICARLSLSINKIKNLRLLLIQIDRSISMHNYQYPKVQNNLSTIRTVSFVAGNNFSQYKLNNEKLIKKEAQYCNNTIMYDTLLSVSTDICIINSRVCFPSNIIVPLLYARNIPAILVDNSTTIKDFIKHFTKWHHAVSYFDSIYAPRLSDSNTSLLQSMFGNIISNQYECTHKWFSNFNIHSKELKNKNLEYIKPKDIPILIDSYRCIIEANLAKLLSTNDIMQRLK